MLALIVSKLLDLFNKLVLVVIVDEEFSEDSAKVGIKK
jgi:hypothetical protein